MVHRARFWFIVGVLGILGGVLIGYLVAKHQEFPPRQPVVSNAETSSRSTSMHLPALQASNLRKVVQELSVCIGRRTAGSEGERNAAYYIRDTFKSYGYDAYLQQFTLADGRLSFNVVATLRGTHNECSSVLLVGGHYDSIGPSPGADDNATGIASMLELARILIQSPRSFGIMFVAFGAEERTDPQNRDLHHQGSRFHANSISDTRSIIAFLNIDMIGYGPDLVVRNRRRGPQWYAAMVLAELQRANPTATYLMDRARTGLSDHEAYENLGIPVAWVERRDNPFAHTANDTISIVNFEYVEEITQALLRHIFSQELSDFACGRRNLVTTPQ